MAYAAKAEADNNERPAFEPLSVDLTQYKTIFIGYPMWGYTFPMIIYTLFDELDFSGKTIIPFNTHMGSSGGGTYRTIEELEPKATVLKGLPGKTNLSDEINEAVMRHVIKNMRKTLKAPDDKYVRSELIRAAAMGENGILKLGKVTDFQCHMLEHQLGAYTDCNHGFGLAVIYPVLYRHIYKSAVSPPLTVRLTEIL